MSGTDSKMRIYAHLRRALRPGELLSWHALYSELTQALLYTHCCVSVACSTPSHTLAKAQARRDMLKDSFPCEMI